ncbi:MAG: VWA domain-containing protein [Anaerolineae bacterium]|nr:VWA domain-containing protein [Anaerolineae bacterium]
MQAQRSRTNRLLAILIALFLLVTALPFACWWGVSRLRAAVTPPEPTLRLAYSPEKRELLGQLLAEFERQGLRTTSGAPMRVAAVEMLPERMVRLAVEGQVDAVCPDSSLWLTETDQRWRETFLRDGVLVGEAVRFAISPVVIAMREDVARSMGYPDRPIGWMDILERAQTEETFSWSHASTSTASGLLATLAQFYAGAGKTRGLTIEDATAQSTLDYVAAVEATVRHYGEGELATVERALEEGELRLDAFVVQEQLVVYYNGRGSDRLVAVYPAEGTLWEDHPLALLEHADLDNDARETFQALKRHLLSPQSQQVVLQHGYRPADLSIPLTGEGSPLTAANGVDPTQPKTVLQMPSAAVVDVVRDVWWYTKRHTNVFLVVDTSGSMQGDKLENARLGLQAFVEGIRGDQERVGMIEFASEVGRTIPLDELGRNRRALEQAIADLSAGGNTALLDAIGAAYGRLQSLGDAERINAIVVMTDGRENASRTRLRELQMRIRDGNARGVPVVVFCIAYGSDADLDTLAAIAETSGGQVRRGDLTSIEELYRLISTYF